MRYDDDLLRGPDDTTTTRSVTDTRRLYSIRSDVLIVIRVELFPRGCL